MAYNLDALFGTPLHNVASIKINHTREKTFRVKSLLELPFVLMGYVIGGIIMIFLFFQFFDVGDFFGRNDDTFSGGDDGGSDSAPAQRNPRSQNPGFRKSRFHNFAHTFRVFFYDAHGNILNQAYYKPLNARDGYDTISRILELAKKEKIVVIENLFFGIERRLTTWYCGMPLLTSPNNNTNLETLLKLFDREGYRVDQKRDSVTLTQKEKKESYIVAFFSLLFSTLTIWIPTNFTNPYQRAEWMNALFNLLNRPEAEKQLTISANEITYSYKRGKFNLVRPVRISGKTIEAFRYYPTLGYDKFVQYKDPSLEIRTQNGPFYLSPGFYGSFAYQFTDLLHLATLRFRERSEDFHESASEKHPVKCPYCGAIYIVEESTNCTSCGAATRTF